MIHLKMKWCTKNVFLIGVKILLKVMCLPNILGEFTNFLQSSGKGMKVDPIVQFPQYSDFKKVENCYWKNP
jgi:hypothetical protein